MESFADIGKRIKDNAKESEVNIIHPFIEVQPKKKLSIIGVYDNSETEIVNGAGEIIPFDESSYYYGMNPEFGADEVCLALKAGAFKDCVSFEKFMDDKKEFFTLPAKMSKYARALFAKTLVKMSVMFGYYFHCDSRACFERFCDIASGIAVKNIDFDTNEKEQTVRLLGQSSIEFLNALDNGFTVEKSGDLTIKTDISGKSISAPIYLIDL